MPITFRHLRDLMPMAQPYAGRCPDFLITQAARQAAVEFCERTRCWRHLLDFDATTATTGSLIPLEAVIWEIETASVDGRPLIPTQHSDVMREGDRVGPPEYISQANPWGVVLHPFPEAGQGPCRVSMSVFLKPRSDQIVGLDAANPLIDDLDVVPEWMLQQHAQRLVDGALARVLMMEGETWYSPQRAAVHREAFEQALSRNFAANMRGQQRAPIRTRCTDF